MTDYSLSNTRKAVEYSQDTDSSISNVIPQKVIVKGKEHKTKVKKRLMPSREKPTSCRKDRSFRSSTKFQNNESIDSEARSIPFCGKKSFKKLGLKDVQKYARNEGPSTGRKSTKSGKDTLNTEELAKLRDLRSIFYKQTAVTNTSEKSVRNKSGVKKLSKNSSASLKNSRRSSNKRSTKTLKKEVSPKTNGPTMMGFGKNSSKKMLNVTNQFNKSKSLIRGTIKKKKKLSKIKLNGRNNKFMNSGVGKKSNHNSSHINSARSKQGAPSGSKESKKSIKLIKKDFIFKPGDGKVRLSKRKKDSISIKAKIGKKNPLKVIKKISPDRIAKPDDNPHFSIPIERAVQYNNY